VLQILEKTAFKQLSSLVCADVLLPDGDGGTLQLSDFGVDSTGPDDATLDVLFDDLVGCDGVKERLEGLRDTVLFYQGRGQQLGDAVSFNWVFTGSPGTGKTTVARRMGRMFCALGLLPDSEVKEVSASDLVTGYVGQTGGKTRELLEQVQKLPLRAHLVTYP
jgi:AAA+ superfamily predicted ATPase